LRSFVPDAEPRLWRTVMRRKYQITRSRVQLHNRLESLLEEAHIKVSSVVSDLLGTSARRMLHALAEAKDHCGSRRGRGDVSFIEGYSLREDAIR
jgi:transposase